MVAVSNTWVPGSNCLFVCFGLVFEVLGMKAIVLRLQDKLCSPEFHSHPAQLLFSNWQTHPNSSQFILPEGETVHLWYHPRCDLSQPSMNRTMIFSIMSANFNIEGTIFFSLTHLLNSTSPICQPKFIQRLGWFLDWKQIWLLSVTVKWVKHSQLPLYQMERKWLASLERNRLLQSSPQRNGTHQEFNPRAQCSISQKHVGGKCAPWTCHMCTIGTWGSERAGQKE